MSEAGFRGRQLRTLDRKGKPQSILGLLQLPASLALWRGWGRGILPIVAIPTSSLFATTVCQKCLRPPRNCCQAGPVSTQADTPDQRQLLEVFSHANSQNKHEEKTVRRRGKDVRTLLQ